jgi:alpha-glucosidase
LRFKAFGVAARVGAGLASLLMSASPVRADDAVATDDPSNNGVVCHVQGGTVSAAAVAPGIFRLSVNYVQGTTQPADSAQAAAPHSIFLGPTDPPPTTELVHRRNRVGVKNDAGELAINPADGSWSFGAADSPLARPWFGPSFGHDASTGDPAVRVAAAWPSLRVPIRTYGCGNGSAALVQRLGNSRVGNGRAVIPYFWSNAGFAVLAVDADDNHPATWSTDEQSVTWTAPGSMLDLYLMPAATLSDAARAYARLSGFPLVPPRWTFGYLQSRWGWKDKAYIDDTLKQFHDRKLPVDAFIFDFEWYTPTPDYELPPTGQADFKDFSFNPLLFPEPAEQIAAMRQQGVHFVGIRKPRLGNAQLLREFHQRGWILPPGAEGVDARCLDFANPQVRDWYAQQLQPLLHAGIDGWWDDEGELTYTTYYYWNAAEREALDQMNPHARLWTIDRAFAPGVQRFGAAAWTGDIRADFKTLHRTATDLLNWSLAGMPYGSCDIGGHLGEDSPALLTRWMQAGALFPNMRPHSNIKFTPRFPWLYGAQAEANIGAALQLRYRLIPLLYSLAHLGHETGAPIMRPLIMQYPTDENVANLSDEWMLGEGLLAAPVLDEGEKRSVYLPAGTWYRFDGNATEVGGRTIDVAAGLNQIPLYVNAGTILPLAPPTLLHTDDLPGGPLELQVYPGKDAAFTLVEDDGMSDGYLNGKVRHTMFHWDDAARDLSWTVQGAYAGKDVFRTMQVRVFDAEGEKRAESDLAGDGALEIGR